MRTSAECCNVWQVRDYTLWRATTHFCMELPIHTSKIDRHFLYSKKRTPGLSPFPLSYALYVRDNDEKDGRHLNVSVQAHSRFGRILTKGTAMLVLLLKYWLPATI
jgi:hypothetical protein